MKHIIFSQAYPSAGLFSIPSINRIIALVCLIAVMGPWHSLQAQSTSLVLTLNSGQRALFRYAFDGGTVATTIGSQVPPGSQLIAFNGATQYQPTITRDRDGWWGPRGTTALARGNAYWLYIPPVGGLVVSSQYTLTFSGALATGPFTLTNAFGYNGVGYPYPVDYFWTNSQCAKSARNNSTLSLWDQPSQSFVGSFKNSRGVWSGVAVTAVVKAVHGVVLFSTGSTVYVETNPN